MATTNNLMEDVFHIVHSHVAMVGVALQRLVPAMEAIRQLPNITAIQYVPEVVLMVGVALQELVRATLDSVKLQIHTVLRSVRMDVLMVTVHLQTLVPAMEAIIKIHIMHIFVIQLVHKIVTMEDVRLLRHVLVTQDII